MKFFQVFLILLCGCAFQQGPQSPELAPVAATIAIYQAAQTHTLRVEFLSGEGCSRITPLDSYRFSLTLRPGTPGATTVVERFVTGRAMTFSETALVKGNYEARVYHEDRLNKATIKRFTIHDSSTLLPCVG